MHRSLFRNSSLDLAHDLLVWPGSGHSPDQTRTVLFLCPAQKRLWPLRPVHLTHKHQPSFPSLKELDSLSRWCKLAHSSAPTAVIHLCSVLLHLCPVTLTALPLIHPSSTSHHSFLPLMYPRMTFLQGTRSNTRPRY